MTTNTNINNNTEWDNIDTSFIYDFDTSACCFNLDGSWNCSWCHGRKTCPEAEEHIKAQEEAQLEKEYEQMIEEELKASAEEAALHIPDFDCEEPEYGTV